MRWGVRGVGSNCGGTKLGRRREFERVELCALSRGRGGGKVKVKLGVGRLWSSCFGSECWSVNGEDEGKREREVESVLEVQVQYRLDRRG